MLDRFWWSTWVYGRNDGIDMALLDGMISLEKRVWGSIKPERVFLITRQNLEGERDNRLHRLYLQLARKEGGAVSVRRIRNDGSIEYAQRQILASFL